MPAALGSLRRPAVAVNAVLALLLAGGVFWAYETLSGPATGTAANASVRSVPVQQGTVTATVSADGSVESASTASASFVTGGTVTGIAVHVGDKVKKGQVLAKVDPAPAQRTLSAAEADLAAARDALARAENAGSDTSSAQNEVTRAQVAVDEAQAGVDGTVLEAPTAGTVVAVNGTIGSSSQSQSGASGTSEESSGFIDLADLSRLQVTAAFAEADATKLKEKQAATVTWNALSGTRQSGRVVAVDPQATTANNVVTYGVTLSLDKVPAGAKPGQTVSVSVVTGAVADALYVNSAAVTTVGNRHTVTVMANGAQQTRQVDVGLEGDQVTQIVSGLSAGEQVVIRTTTTTTGGTQGGFPGGGPGGLTGGGAPAGGGFPGGGTGRAGR
ncbi:efflux RND transporter periplasmic adaptor subunit [Couchioplanes caeruleus]|uniref:efflux RND transporter periplasmic adaptor subunit n=1 Tax=Couchioplanes caeruleus TaxID=56438 RepID=UPI00201BB8F2|nr:efflux RND transporter periplasmic adaptor subunit [Couchioplanes caeruleus]UQU61336.1 efflux RND transporter periplasmic adaptor subunit [Couchioplanes caeruleus]